MICPYCKVDKNRTVAARWKGDTYIRYRKCLSCDKRFKTVEYYCPDLPTDKIGRVKSMRRKRNEERRSN